MIGTLALMLALAPDAGRFVPNPTGAKNYQIVVTLPKTSFGHDEPIPMICDFRNRSATDVTIWYRFFHCNHRIRLVDERGKVATLTKAGHEVGEWFSPNGGPSATFPIVVKSGKSYRTFGQEGSPNNLRGLFLLPPGKYRLTVEHIENRAPPMNLVSRPVEFEVRPKGADQAPARGTRLP